jgi:hypothetical protein
MGDWVDPTRLSPMTAYMLDSSDVITFHSYDDSATVERLVTALERYGRPIICSEYMWYRDYKGEPDVWFTTSSRATEGRTLLQKWRSSAR